MNCKFTPYLNRKYFIAFSGRTNFTSYKCVAVWELKKKKKVFFGFITRNVQFVSSLELHCFVVTMPLNYPQNVNNLDKVNLI